MTNQERREFLIMQQENLALKHRLVTDELAAVNQAIQAEEEAKAKADPGGGSRG